MGGAILLALYLMNVKATPWQKNQIGFIRTISHKKEQYHTLIDWICHCYTDWFGTVYIWCISKDLNKWIKSNSRLVTVEDKQRHGLFLRNIKV